MFSSLLRRRKPQLHSRRWECANVQTLRRAIAKLSAEQVALLLVVRKDELREELVASGMPPAQADTLTSRYYSPELLERVAAFFDRTLRENDFSRDQWIPRSILNTGAPLLSSSRRSSH